MEGDRCLAENGRERRSAWGDAGGKCSAQNPTMHCAGQQRPRPASDAGRPLALDAAAAAAADGGDDGW